MRRFFRIRRSLGIIKRNYSPMQSREARAPVSHEAAGRSQAQDTRREFLKKAGLGALTLAGAKGGYELVKKMTEEKRTLVPPRPPERAKKMIERMPEFKSYEMGRLAGRKFGDLYSLYTGISGEVPPVAEIDFTGQLIEMWQRKVRTSEENPEVRQAGVMLLREYADHGRDRMQMDIVQYEKKIRETIAPLQKKGGIDWERVAQVKRLDEQSVRVVRALANRVSGKDLLAYAATELMPSPDGDLNVEVFDFLLRNAGARYVNSIPALHDTKTSFGPFQFTDLALYDALGEQRGASIVNRAVDPSYKVPASVMGLRDFDHHRAAFLLAIDNLSLLVKKLSKKELVRLMKHVRAGSEDIVTFIATAHHAPATAVKNANAWAARGMKKPYAEYCSGVLRDYAEKTARNREALEVIA